jgi:hypothetical protein
MTKTKQQQQQKQNKQEEKKNLTKGRGQTNSNFSSSKSSSGRQQKTLLYSSSFSFDEKRYLHAINYPADPINEGVVVPDRFPFPTCPYHGRGKTTLVSNGGGTLDFIWIPGATATLFVLSGTVGGGLVNDMYTVISSGIYAHASDGAFAACLDTWRPVYGCAVLSNDMSFSNVTGAGIVVPFVCKDIGMNQTTMSVAANVANISSIFSSGAQSNLAAPGAVEFKMDQLISEDLILPTRPVDPTGYKFRDCSFVTDAIGNNTDVFVGQETFSATTGLVTGASSTAGNNCAGMLGYRITVTGLPLSTPVLELEMHLGVEGSQTTNLTSNNFMVPSGWKRNQSVMGNVESVLSALPKELIYYAAPIVSNVVKKAGRSFLAALV